MRCLICMSWLDEPYGDIPCLLRAAEDEWHEMTMDIASIKEGTVELPSGKKVPQLEFEADDCTVCGKDGPHQLPFWAMRDVHEILQGLPKRTTVVKIEFQRSVLPNGKNRASFRLE